MSQSRKGTSNWANLPNQRQVWKKGIELNFPVGSFSTQSMGKWAIPWVRGQIMEDQENLKSVLSAFLKSKNRIIGSVSGTNCKLSLCLVAERRRRRRRRRRREKQLGWQGTAAEVQGKCSPNIWFAQQESPNSTSCEVYSLTMWSSFEEPNWLFSVKYCLQHLFLALNHCQADTKDRQNWLVHH